MKVRHASSLVTLIIVLRALPVAAQDYPAKPVRLIVNTAAGGLMDVAARVTADYLGKALGQRFIIENRPVGRKHWDRCGRESGARRLHARTDSAWQCCDQSAHLSEYAV